MAIIEGVVTDYNFVPLVGVTISIVDTTIGTVSAIDGSYKIQNNLASNARIRFSFIGYKERIVSLNGNKKFVSVMLQEECYDTYTGKVFSWRDYESKYSIKFFENNLDKCPSYGILENKFPLKIPSSLTNTENLDNIDGRSWPKFKSYINGNPVSENYVSTNSYIKFNKNINGNLETTGTVQIKRNFTKMPNTSYYDSNGEYYMEFGIYIWVESKYVCLGSFSYDFNSITEEEFNSPKTILLDFSASSGLQTCSIKAGYLYKLYYSYSIYPYNSQSECLKGTIDHQFNLMSNIVAKEYSESFKIASFYSKGYYEDIQCPPSNGIEITSYENVFDFKINNSEPSAKNIHYLKLNISDASGNMYDITAFANNPCFINSTSETFEINLGYSYLGDTGSTIESGCEMFILDGIGYDVGYGIIPLNKGCHTISVEGVY